MATSRMASIASRPHYSTLIALTIVLVGTSGGCKSRRQAMRPVYSGPGYTAVPVRPGASSSVIVDEPISSSAPPRVDLPDENPRLSPTLPPVDSGFQPSRGGSPPPADEPGLRVPPNPGVERTPKANIRGPELDGPSASRSTPRRTSTTRVRESSLQDRVRPFVNDPDDLFQPPKADRPWKYIVVHHSANASGSYDQIDREHRKIQGWDGCGYHFVIGNGTDSPDGQVEVARRWTNQKHGLHCRNGKNPDVNEYGIGICLIGNLDNAPPTAKQVAAARALVAYLARRYEIPADRAGTHAEMADGPTACPGKNFPEAEIFGSKHLAAN